MSQYERRLYEPSDEARIFDGGEDDFPEDESSRLPLLIVIALVVLASFAGVVWVAYTQGVQRGREDAPRILAGEQEHDGTLNERQNPYAKLQIYKPTNPGTETDQSAASPISPERVAPSTATDQGSESAVAGAPENAPSLAPAVSSASTRAKTPFIAPDAVTPPLAKTPAAMPATPPNGGLAQAANQPHSAVGAPRHIIPPPVHPPVRLNAVAQPPQRPAETPIQTGTTATDAMQAAQSAAQPAQDGFVLQIGSYASEAEANASWQTYKLAHDSVSDYAPDIKAADLGRRGIWYRLRIGPFATLAAANAACARLKAQGAGCFAAKQ